MVCLQSTITNTNIVFQGRIVIYICGGFTLANTHAAFCSSLLQQGGGKTEDLWFIFMTAG